MVMMMMMINSNFSPLHSLRFFSFCFFICLKNYCFCPAPMLLILPGLMVHFMGIIDLISPTIFLYRYIHIFFYSFCISTARVRLIFTLKEPLFSYSFLYAYRFIRSYTIYLSWHHLYHQKSIFCCCCLFVFCVIYGASTHCTTQPYVDFFLSCFLFQQSFGQK